MNRSIAPKRLVITDSNRVAASAACSIATDLRTPISTLLVSGPCGTGKTLILRTIEATHRSLHPDATCIFLNAGDLLRWPEDSPDDAWVDADLVLVDDIDLLAKRPSAQQSLLAVIETVERLALGRVAMTSSMPPDELAATLNMVPRLLSRLYGATSVEVSPPPCAMRDEIIRSELEQWPAVRLSRALTKFMARELPADGHIVVGAAKRIALQTQLDGDEPDQVTTAAILRENFAARRRIPVSAIQERTAAHFHIPLREMTSARRARDVARPRQVSMFLSKQLTPKSLPDIGRIHGNRDHTTVIHAIRTIEKLRIEDRDLDLSIKILERELTH